MIILLWFFSIHEKSAEREEDLIPDPLSGKTSNDEDSESLYGSMCEVFNESAGSKQHRKTGKVSSKGKQSKRGRQIQIIRQMGKNTRESKEDTQENPAQGKTSCTSWAIYSKTDKHNAVQVSCDLEVNA